MIKMPILDGCDGCYYFNIQNETSTKFFHHAGDFDETSGVYPIYNEKNEIVEYMDVLGNFTQKPTRFAKLFYRYVTYEQMLPLVFKRNQLHSGYACAFDSFPIKYFLNKKFVQLIKDEENRKIEEMKRQKFIYSFFDVLGYRLSVIRNLKEKINMAKALENNKADEDVINN